MLNPALVEDEYLPIIGYPLGEGELDFKEDAWIQIFYKTTEGL